MARDPFDPSDGDEVAVEINYDIQYSVWQEDDDGRIYLIGNLGSFDYNGEGQIIYPDWSYKIVQEGEGFRILDMDFGNPDDENDNAHGFIIVGPLANQGEDEEEENKN